MATQVLSNRETELLLEIRGFIWAKGGRHSNWYVGISARPERRLFQDHGVRRSMDDWIFRRASTPEEAHRVAAYFIDGLGTAGSAARTLRGPTYVYAFRRTPNTRP